MANSDKNILITPNTSAATGTYPTIKFTGADNTPITMRVLDNGTLSFEGTAGQLFSISDGLSGTIFSVNDISGIPSIEVLDTGLIKLNQYGGSTVIGGSSAVQNASSVNAKLSVYTASATSPGFIIKGAASQSANLQEWQNSTSAILSKIDSAGNLTAASLIKTGGTSSQYLMADGSVSTSSGTGLKNSYSTGSPTSPTPVVGDLWTDSDTGALYTYINDGSGNKWIEVGATGSISGGSVAWSNITSTPTTLSGYGITDALSNSTTSTQAGYFGDIYLYDDSTPSHYLQITNSANLTAARLLNINTNDADRTISLSGNLTVSSAATISGTNTGDQTITLTGDVTGSGTGSFATTLANSGATAGTYKSVTVDIKGRVTAGTNPTTLSGYGITDAIDTSATAQTKSGTLTAASFIPTSSTVPTNGMYLSAANTLNFATNTTNRMSIDSAGLVTIPGSLTVTGDLIINGTTTNINTTNLVVEDKNIILGDVATPSNTTADGGGITLKGGIDKTFNWVNATGSWTSSEDLDLASGKVLRIAGTQVLSATNYTGNAATVTNGVYTNGSYSNPSWITGLAWSKISTTPTTLSGYGITDAAALSGATFTGTVITPAATTSISSLRIPHGTAPTTPTNGDIWTTTAGIYVRINGTTVGPLGSGGGTTLDPDPITASFLFGGM